MPPLEALKTEVRDLRTRLDRLEASLRDVSTVHAKTLGDLEGIWEGIPDSTPEEIAAALYRGAGPIDP